MPSRQTCGSEPEDDNHQARGRCLSDLAVTRLKPLGEASEITRLRQRLAVI